MLSIYFLLLIPESNVVADIQAFNFHNSIYYQYSFILFKKAQQIGFKYVFLSKFFQYVKRLSNDSGSLGEIVKTAVFV